MKDIEIPIQDISEHFAALAKIGNLGPTLEDGFLRASWSNEESEAINYIRSVGEAAGLKSRFDSFGNFFLRSDSDSPEVVQIGSHLDTVPKGGLFDGGAGIVAGLEAIRAVLSSDRPVQKALELVIWRGEESGTFGTGLKGSRMAFGMMNPSELEAVYEGLNLADAMTSQDSDPEAVRSGTPSFSQTDIDRIAAHFELHIEQANKLETDVIPIGIATSIRSALRLRIVIRGHAAHSGATPMGMEYRQDANLAMAYMHTRLDELCQARLKDGADLVQTVGVINSSKDINASYPEVFENGLTKVSPFAYFLLDIRSSSLSTLDAHAAEAQNLLRKTAKEFGVTAEIEEISAYGGIPEMNKEMQDVLESSCKDLEISCTLMPCGAGHDCATVGRQQKSNGSHVPANLLLIPCRDGLSHHPLEYTTDEAVQTGARVLAEAIYRVARFPA